MSDSINPPQIEPASLIWQNGVPVSEKFGDVYFCRENGLEESRYVFIRHNQLTERFSCVPSGGHFVIAETGFGSGLSFLAAWQAWLDSKPNHTATLHFISVERFPLSRNDLVQVLDLWPALAPLAKQLIDAYPPLVQGAHRLVLDGGSVRLTLYFGDILEAWKSLSFKADAWFLDGFAPSLNPQMWQDEAIGLIRDHSMPGTTLATFTSVGRIRRALESVGFIMQKVKGFGHKRDMIAGRLPYAPSEESKPVTDSVTIIGAGIAGCILARNLADRGVKVILIDAADQVGAAASGNRQGAMYVKLGVEFNDQTRLALTSLLFSQRFYRSFGGKFWHPTGLLQMAWSQREHERQQHLLLRNSYPVEILFPIDKETASQLTGCTTPAGGIWFPGNGWIEPAGLCNFLTEHPMITRVFNFTADKLTSTDTQWRISGQDPNTTLYASQVIICAGHHTPELIPGGGVYRFRSVRGQVTHLNGDNLNAPTAVICGQRYVNPSDNGIALTGSTFDPDDDNPHTTRASHYENLTELQNMLPGALHAKALFARSIEFLDNLEGKTAFRCTTHDYQPVAGEHCDAQGKPVTGVYLLTGFGSKGLTYAPLLAEYIADIVCKQPACLPVQLARRVETHRMHSSDMA
ncbi:MAG TPA: bifunctional tRNA (5-methylaminomethyl-2-thiouridine)(34)-methyltransferase MnmD/FAD-dependent 5-carboxymethylaminomethyl-2-thiouridine(34) oxidoreductase MnmC [Marinobacter sp.]|nr:bifunctional tRNA (5-methylaminomethyl-2-thiouridine)(34)-methyltransferase MnmD/FAD-dependent 5-carboxymethylaminomethyl-2-thiouridine(34) oxidoreductase MnmC [Marinobacter sp.]